MENQDSSSTNVVQVPVENPDVQTNEAYDDTIYRPSPLTEFIGDFYIEEFKNNEGKVVFKAVRKTWRLHSNIFNIRINNYLLLVSKSKLYDPMYNQLPVD